MSRLGWLRREVTVTRVILTIALMVVVVALFVGCGGVDGAVGDGARDHCPQGEVLERAVGSPYAYCVPRHEAQVTAPDGGVVDHGG